jgi:hypothetical protein
MTHEKVLAALAECERLIRVELEKPPSSFDSTIDEERTARRFPPETAFYSVGRIGSLRHCLALCVEVKTWGEDRKEKAMRWLGWIQGVMWVCLGNMEIATLKEMNKP